MSLLQRVERAQQRAGNLVAGTPVEEAAPAAIPVPVVTPGRVAAREELIREIRLRLQTEVMAAFDSLLDVTGPEGAARDQGRGDRRPDRRRQRVRGDARRAARLVEELVGEVGGLGPLDPLLADESITEIMVNGPNHLYIERAGKILRVDSVFLNDEHVLRIIDRIITPLGRRIDETSPRVDARLPDGSRVNAVIEPLSLVGPVITVRKFPAKPITVDDLIRFGTATPEMFEFLKACVEARLNVFVSGGTGSGKTTTLNVLSSFIPEDERIVTIEDAAELQLRQDARRDARVASAEPRGPRRDHHPRPVAQRPAHAPRPHHRRGVSRGRGAGHAPGDDDRPGRLAVDRPREHPAGTCSAGSRRWS